MPVSTRCYKNRFILVKGRIHGAKSPALTELKEFGEKRRWQANNNSRMFAPIPTQLQFTNKLGSLFQKKEGEALPLPPLACVNSSRISEP